MAKENGTEILAIIKYEGELVKDGYLDVKKSSKSLDGIDEMLRFFILKEFPELAGYEFEIPVRIRKGSWEVLFNTENFLWVIGTYGVGKYVGAALEQMAKNDFENISLKDVGIKTFEALINVIRIAKHLGSMTIKKIENPKFRNDNKEIGIPNSEEEYIWVSKKDLDNYVGSSEKLFNKLVKPVEKERELEITLYESKGKTISEKISEKDKFIFAVSEEKDEILFPELVDGEFVELEGHITKGNQSANSIGFLYNGHILYCYPAIGNITDNKSALFTNCIIKGYIDRTNKETILLERKPKIRYTEIIPFTSNTSNTLFDK